MRTTFSRTDESILGRWWWSVDRWMIAAIISILACGAILALAASPAVAKHHNLDTFFFAQRHFIVIPVSIIIMFAASLLARKGVRQLAVICFCFSVLLLILTLLIGVETKGAVRWINLGGFSIQPSEFVKPSFTIISAWMFSAWRLKEGFPGYLVSVGLYLAVVSMLLMQPDVGMTILISVVWGIQFFLAGLPMILVSVIGLIFITGGFAAYFNFNHVQIRIDRFFDPAGNEAFQVERSLEAFRNGGVFGRGPGEGHVKEVLPDAHADFIFAVAGEEFGLMMTLFLVGLLPSFSNHFLCWLAVLPSIDHFLFNLARCCFLNFAALLGINHHQYRMFLQDPFLFLCYQKPIKLFVIHLCMDYRTDHLLYQKLYHLQLLLFQLGQNLYNLDYR